MTVRGGASRSTTQFYMCYSVLQYAAVCCSVLQCVAVCCSMLQCVAVCDTHIYVAHSARWGKSFQSVSCIQLSRMKWHICDASYELSPCQI